MTSVPVNLSSALYQDESLPSCQASNRTQICILPLIVQGLPILECPPEPFQTCLFVRVFQHRPSTPGGLDPYLDLLKVVLLNHHQAGLVFSACPDVYPASFVKPVPLRSPSSWIPVVSVVSFLHIWWALHQKCTFHICVLTSLDLRTQGVLLNH